MVGEPVAGLEKQIGFGIVQIDGLTGLRKRFDKHDLRTGRQECVEASFGFIPRTPPPEWILLVGKNIVVEVGQNPNILVVLVFYLAEMGDGDCVSIPNKRPEEFSRCGSWRIRAEVIVAQGIGRPENLHPGHEDERGAAKRFAP